MGKLSAVHNLKQRLLCLLLFCLMAGMGSAAPIVHINMMIGGPLKINLHPEDEPGYQFTTIFHLAKSILLCHNHLGLAPGI